MFFVIIESCFAIGLASVLTIQSGVAYPRDDFYYPVMHIHFQERKKIENVKDPGPIIQRCYKDAANFAFLLQLSWADLEVFAVSEYFEGKPESKAFLETFPVVIAHVKAVKELPKIAAYLAQRPVTEY